jgi:hypothetical protein
LFVLWGEIIMSSVTTDLEMPELRNPFRKAAETVANSSSSTGVHKYEEVPLAVGGAGDDDGDDEPPLPSSDVPRRTRGPPSRKSFCRKFLCRSFFVVILYVVLLEVWVNILASSHSGGCDPNDQRLGPVALLLLPLTPYIRYENNKAMPRYAEASITTLPADTTYRKVAVMPELLHYQESNLSQSVDFHLAGELSGCTPKFELMFGENKYLFKPSEHKVQVWNELVAFLINKYGGFGRVPPVHPFELPFTQVKQSVEDTHAVASLPFVKCDFDLPGIQRWLRTSDGNIIGTLQLMVPGVWKRSKTTQRSRCKIGKWTDQPLSVLAQREINTRTLFDILIGNYDRYNNDFIQFQPDKKQKKEEDRILVYIDQGSQAPRSLVYSESFPMQQYCRFYWKPIQALRTYATNLTNVITTELVSNEMTRQWNDEGLIDIETHPSIRYLQDRVTAVLGAVDQCLEEYGHEYVFTDL